MKTETLTKTDLEMEVGTLERRKEIAKAEVDALERRRKEIFAEHEVHKQVALVEASKKIAEWKKLQEQVEQRRNDLAESQSKHLAMVSDLSNEKAAFESERNALREQVKQAEEKTVRIQHFLKAIDLARVGL